MSANQQEAVGGNLSFSAAGLAEGTNAATIKTVNTLQYSIDGVLKTKAATDNVATGAAGSIAAGKTAILGVFIDVAGTISTVLGKEVDNAELANGSVVLHYPADQADKAWLGAVKIKNASASPFVVGTTDLSAASITATYQDLSCRPSKPITS